MSSLTLVVLSVAAAALGLGDLLTGFAGGVALIVAPIVGAALAGLAATRGTSRGSAAAALALNGLVFVTAVVVGFVFGGS